MAWSETGLASRETTDLGNDKPLVAVQAIPVSPTTVKWVDGTQVGAGGNLGTWTDRTDSDYPARYAYDGYPGYITKPDATADNEWYLAFDLGEAVDFDCVFLIGSNFGTLALTTIDVEVADDNAFAGGDLQTVATLAASDDRRADLSIGSSANQRVTAQYVWLKLARVANFTPQLTELILGRRRQWQYKPDRPFGDKNLRNETATAKTAGGVSHKTVFAQNQFTLECGFPLDDSSYVTDMVAFFKACRGAFVWVYDPSSAPNSWHLLMKDDDSLIMPMTEPSRYEVSLVASEQGPEQYWLANE